MMNQRQLLQLLFYPLLLLLHPTPTSAVLQQGQTSSLMHLQQDARLDGPSLRTLENPVPGRGYGCVQRCTGVSGCRAVSMSPDGSSCTLGGQVSVCQPGVVTPAAGWTTYYKALYNFGDHSYVIQLRSKASGDLCLDKAEDVATTVQGTTVVDTTTGQATTQPTTLPTTQPTTMSTTEPTTMPTTLLTTTISATPTPTPTPTPPGSLEPSTSAITREGNTGSTATEATVTKTTPETTTVTTEGPHESTHQEGITTEANHQTSSVPSYTTIMTTQNDGTTVEEITTQNPESTTAIPNTTEESTNSGSFNEVKEGGNCTSFIVKSPGLSGQAGTISLLYSSAEEGVECYLMTRNGQVGIAAGSGSATTGSGFLEETTFCPVVEKGEAGLYRLVQNGTEQLSIVGGRLVLLPTGGQQNNSSLFYL